MKMLLDSNLLILYVVGLASREYIGKHKRLTAYVPDDFDAISSLIERATEVLVTPHVLAETSNLAAQIGNPAREEIMQVLAKAIDVALEHYVPSKSAIKRSEFLRLGLTDAALLELASKGITIVTSDLNLYLAAEQAGTRSINFNHLRDSYLR